MNKYVVLKLDGEWKIRMCNTNSLPEAIRRANQTNGIVINNFNLKTIYKSN